MDGFLNRILEIIPEGLPSASKKNKNKKKKDEKTKTKTTPSVDDLQCFETWNSDIKYSKKNQEKGICKMIRIIQYVGFRVTCSKDGQLNIENITNRKEQENEVGKTKTKKKKKKKKKEEIKHYFIKEWKNNNEEKKKIDFEKRKLALTYAQILTL